MSELTMDGLALFVQQLKRGGKQNDTWKIIKYHLILKNLIVPK